jgi:hypothetical protein
MIADAAWHQQCVRSADWLKYSIVQADRLVQLLPQALPMAGIPAGAGSVFNHRC